MAQDKPTRERILEEAMRMFGQRGYDGTGVADIEAAAGLANGSGGLYRHFRSKRALLEAGVRRQIASNRGLISRLGERSRPEDSLLDRLRELARVGLERLDQERDLNRLIVRDLRHFPDLLELTAESELRPVQEALALALRLASRPPTHPGVDIDALAAVLTGAVAHYWLLRDVFGDHPSGVTPERYIEALARLTATALDQP